MHTPRRRSTSRTREPRSARSQERLSRLKPKERADEAWTGSAAEYETRRYPRFGLTRRFIDWEHEHSKPRPNPPEVYYEPEPELLFWHTVLGWLLSPTKPNMLSRVIHFLFVAPYTNVTSFSLFYQQWLNELVHRKLPTRIGHHICTPIITMFFWACFWRVRLFDGFTVFGHHIVGNGTFAALLVFQMWYSIWGFTAKKVEQVPLLGLLNLPTNIALFVGARWWMMTYDNPTMPWYNPTGSIYTNPIALNWFFAALQSLSHAFEKYLPPRCSEYNYWVVIMDYLKVPLGTKIIYIIQMFINGVWGTVDEWLGAPRLQAVYTLEYWRRATGYKKDQYEYLMQFVREAISDRNGNDAALDYIGTGGGSYLWEAKQVDGKYIQPLWPDLRGRLYDWGFVFLFCLLLYICYFVDIIPALAPAGGLTREWAANQSWPPQYAYEMFFWYTERYDPLTLSNPDWAKVMGIFSPLFFGPIFMLAIYGFIMGDNVIRTPLLWWAGMSSMSVGTMYTLLWFGPVGQRSPNPLMMTLFWAPYLLGVPLTIWRVWNDPFPEKKKTKK